MKLFRNFVLVASTIYGAVALAHTQDPIQIINTTVCSEVTWAQIAPAFSAAATDEGYLKYWLNDYKRSPLASAKHDTDTSGQGDFALMNLIIYYGERGMIKEYNQLLQNSTTSRVCEKHPQGDTCNALTVMIKEPQKYMAEMQAQRQFVNENPSLIKQLSAAMDNMHKTIAKDPALYANAAFPKLDDLNKRCDTRQPLPADYSNTPKAPAAH